MTFVRKCVVLHKAWSGVLARRAFSLSVNRNLLNKVTVCIEGNIGCGKTTFISHFQNYGDIVEKCEEPVTFWRDYGDVNPLSAMYNDPKRWAFTFQSLVLLTMLQRHDQDQLKPVRVLERSVYSVMYCFIENQRNGSLLTEFEYVLLNEWFSECMKKYNIDVDLVVYLRTSPEVCYQRIKRRNRPEEQNITLEYLQQLHDLHENWLIRRESSSSVRSSSQNKGDNSSIIRPPVLIVDGDPDMKIVEDRFPGIHSQIMSELQYNLG